MLLLGILLFAALCALWAGLTAGLLAAVLALLGGFVGGLLLVLLFLVVASFAVNRDKVQENDSKFYRTLAHLYIDLAITLGRIDVRAEGFEKAPQSGRILLVCNHLHEIDPAIIMKCLPKAQLAFIAKRETKNMPIISHVMHKLMCPLINRENDREALKTILHCIDLLKQDKVSIGVFPEGYVSMDGRLRHFRGGVFKIAQKAGVPVVICTISNTKRVIQDLLHLRRTYVRIHLVDVLDVETVRATPTVELAEQIYEIMISDLGEKYRCEERATHPDEQVCAEPIE